MIKIYKYTNKTNGKVYIGQTSQSIKQRAGKNGSRYTSYNSSFGSAIKKYGWSNFDLEILKDNIATKHESNYWEWYYVEQYKSNNKEFGYNCTNGGDSAIYGLTEETKQKVSKGLRESKTWRNNNLKAHVKLENIVLYDVKTGNIIKIYESEYAAYTDLGIVRTNFKPFIRRFSIIHDKYRVLYEDKTKNDQMLYQPVYSIDNNGNIKKYKTLFDAIVENKYQNIAFIKRSIERANDKKYRYKFDNKFWYLDK